MSAGSVRHSGHATSAISRLDQCKWSQHLGNSRSRRLADEDPLEPRKEPCQPLVVLAIEPISVECFGPSTEPEEFAYNPPRRKVSHNFCDHPATYRGVLSLKIVAKISSQGWMATQDLDHYSLSSGIKGFILADCTPEPHFFGNDSD